MSRRFTQVARDRLKSGEDQVSKHVSSVHFLTTLSAKPDEVVQLQQDLLFHRNQGKMVEAEEMYVWALQGYERAVGTDHWKTRTNTHNLRNLRKHHE
jgi:hypothetical protein